MENQKEQSEIIETLDQLISFSIGDEDFGVDIQTVKEVIKYREITRLPKAPAFVKGIIKNASLPSFSMHNSIDQNSTLRYG